MTKLLRAFGYGRNSDIKYLKTNVSPVQMVDSKKTSDSSLEENSIHPVSKVRETNISDRKLSPSVPGLASDRTTNSSIFSQNTLEQKRAVPTSASASATTKGQTKRRTRLASPPPNPDFSHIPPTPPTDPNTPPLSSMSKLSSSLKTLINAPFSKPSYTVPNTSALQPLLNKLASSAQSQNVSIPAWLTISTATAMTMNSPSAMSLIWSTAQAHDQALSPVTAAELQREVGLKCISFNGIPRTINCLGAFYGALPSDVRSKLSTKATRAFSPENIEQRKTDGLALWDSVYYGFERKLLDKLAQSHPDLPVHIINSHYAGSLSNPSRTTYVDGKERPRETQVGRVLTSLVAIACLRAQTGVGPQVVSHLFGLRKAYERGDAQAQGEVEVKGGKWLSSEDGNRWILEWIDELVRGIGTAQEGEDAQQKASSGTSFAPGIGAAKEKAKL